MEHWDKSKVLGLVLIAVVVVTGACGLNQKGIVLFTDAAYTASVIGSNADGFTVPDGIRWVQGRFLIADEGGAAIRLWSGPGHSTTLCDSKIGVMSPEDVVIDDVGNIYFTDDDAGGLWKINNFGEARQLVSKDDRLRSTEGIALAPNGDLLVGEGETHQIFAVNAEGVVSEYLPASSGIRKPESMVFDEKGNLFIADNDDNVLYLLTPDKVLHRMIEHRDGFSPETLWYSKGTLYITDSSHGKLFKYTPEDGLQVIAVFGGQLHAVNGVTTDDQGSIFVSVQTDLAKKRGHLIKIEHN